MGEKKQTVLDNINYQPTVLPEVFDRRALFTEPFVSLLQSRDIKKVVFLGSGTSYNVSQIAAYYMQHLAGMDAEACYPTVFCNYDRLSCAGTVPPENVLLVGISQSGTSVSTCRAMAEGHSLGYATVAITGDLHSKITQYVDLMVPLLVGEELTPPETKGYTVSVLSVYLWALAVAHNRGTLSELQFTELMKELKNLLQGFQDVLTQSLNFFERNKASLVSSERIYILGYGIDYGSMLEGVLKVGEMLRVPVIGYELEEYVHGPFMAIRDNQTIILIGSDEAEFDRMLTFRETFKKYTPRVHVLTTQEIDSDERDLVFSQNVSKWVGPLLFTVPFQYLAAAGAKSIYIDTGIDPTDELLAHYRA
ncbi:SIS domain-containing protein [Collinsella sp. AGMB00827]|uniref:SIS domain-containing protein n=1 Tax=Collinsella ureilytica TaxID=2869515 RepID=A0ABS7MI25_9ACTN|nr:SIS domain-containing protein [Collinsella urealyticum]MBY4797019.1 SIS domain-containing protein [Collinsella urealyticum]